VTACTDPSDVTILAPEAAWIEWPAEVRAGEPFDVRLVGYYPGCYPRQELRIEVLRTDVQVAVRTEWLIEGANDNNPLCDPGLYDTLVTVAGLAAANDRTYEVLTVHPDRPPPRPVGTILVRPTGPIATDPRNGLGTVVGSTDIEGCAVMQRAFDAPIPVDNPPADQWLGYVFGYFFTPAAPLCGQTRVFHLTAGP